MTSRTIYECDTCGDDVEEDDVFTCHECGCDLCSNCYHACYGCNEIFCGDDVTYSESCDEDYCDSCLPDDDNENVPDEEDYGRFIERVPASKRNSVFTIGFEIEVDDINARDREVFNPSDIFVAHHHDVSLYGNNQEWNTDALTTTKHIEELARLIKAANIHDTGNAGGHIHVKRTNRQTPSRWYWALMGLSDSMARALNMRHADISRNRWCRLEHGDYYGKSTAVNGDHDNTIELRTFGAWTSDNTEQLLEAAQWLRRMWKYFEAHAVGSISSNAIQREARENAEPVESTACVSLRMWRKRNHVTSEMLHDYDSYASAMRRQKEAQRLAEIRANVTRNIEASRRARNSHGRYVMTREQKKHLDIVRYRETTVKNAAFSVNQSQAVKLYLERFTAYEVKRIAKTLNGRAVNVAEVRGIVANNLQNSYIELQDENTVYTLRPGTDERYPFITARHIVLSSVSRCIHFSNIVTSRVVRSLIESNGRQTWLEETANPNVIRRAARRLANVQ